MEKYFKRKAPEPDSGINPRNLCVEDINWEEEIKFDPGLRKEIDKYHPNLREKRKQHIDVAWNSPSGIAKRAYFTRLNGPIDTARLLLKQGLPFRGHDESNESSNKGNFMELYDCLAEHDPKLHKAVTTNAAGNSCMLAAEIQRDIVECFAKKILHSILEELGNDVFCLLVDESRDVSCKEQMAVVLGYVDKCGIVKERFVGLVHVTETNFFSPQFKLSLKQVRGQGYDGASNMRGEFNGLQSLIMRESSSAYYVHCFAHQLQLVNVATVRKHKGISNFLTRISILLNVVGGSAKRRDLIRDINHEQVRKALGCGQLETGTGDHLRLHVGEGKPKLAKVSGKVLAGKKKGIQEAMKEVVAKPRLMVSSRSSTRNNRIFGEMRNLVLLNELGPDDVEHHAVNLTAISSNSIASTRTLNHASVNELTVETLRYIFHRHVTGY
ncbi:hypothetical protein U9M48_014904 [Paspalum notatum var. saurae]|uniref:DUF4371 domain-containing protein n=1 Tax=Paspalum notatum var. saurae TaxID=547442 RepID=A0AAQ3WL28_PASNO